MQIRYIKYTLISALVGALLWAILIELDARSGLWIFRLLDPVYILLEAFQGHPVPGLIAIVTGTYIGLWSIGKIRKPSFFHGILLGLVSFILFLPFSVLFVGIWLVEHGGGSMVFPAEVALVLGNIVPVGWIYGSVAGVIGVAIVRRISPSFCPNCGNKLPPGLDPCPKCGTSP